MYAVATGTELIHPQDLWATILEDSRMSLPTLTLCASILRKPQDPLKE